MKTACCSRPFDPESQTILTWNKYFGFVCSLCGREYVPIPPPTERPIPDHNAKLHNMVHKAAHEAAMQAVAQYEKEKKGEAILQYTVAWRDLWNHLAKEHDLHLIESELYEIIRLAKKIRD